MAPLLSFFQSTHFALFLVLILGIHAQDIHDLPPCSDKCAKDAAAAAGCGRFDVSCLCKSQLFVTQGVQCVISGCPTEELGPASSILLKTCQTLPFSTPPSLPGLTTTPGGATQPKPPATSSSQVHPATTSSRGTSPQGTTSSAVQSPNPTNTRPVPTTIITSNQATTSSLSAASSDALTAFAAVNSTASISESSTLSSSSGSSTSLGVSVASPEATANAASVTGYKSSMMATGVALLTLMAYAA